MKKIAKSQLNEFIARLMKSYAVYGPVEEEGIVSFRRLTAPEEIRLDYQNSKKPPKEAFFPQTETMFRYEMGKGRISLESTEEVEEERVLFGARPCDVRALELLDLVFDAPDYKDLYYINKREKTTIVALGCNSPLSTCFCTSFEGGPFTKEGADLFLTDIGDWYLAEALTPKGERLLDEELFQEATKADVRAAAKVEKEALAKMAPPLELDGLKEKLDTMIDSPFWDRLHEKCLGCGVCTFLCPTCHCFDIVDEALNSKGERVRNWDSCMFPIYTLEASGHNPRPSGRERWRQRLMHKFDYFVANYGRFLCIGCGRCVINCPVNLDIRKVIADVMAF